MNSVDAEIIRNIRREIGKRPVEATRVDIQVVQGRVTLNGTVTKLRDQPNVDVKIEMDALVKNISRDRLVREVSNMVRVLESHDDKSHENNSRGRVRPH